MSSFNCNSRNSVHTPTKKTSKMLKEGDYGNMNLGEEAKDSVSSSSEEKKYSCKVSNMDNTGGGSQPYTKSLSARKALRSMPTNKFKLDNKKLQKLEDKLKEKVVENPDGPLDYRLMFKIMYEIQKGMADKLEDTEAV